MFACVINEPEDQSAPWPLEKAFHILLKNKANPNQINDLTKESPLIHAWVHKKYRSMVALLEQDGIDLQVTGDKGQTILGLAVNAVEKEGNAAMEMIMDQP